MCDPCMTNEEKKQTMPVILTKDDFTFPSPNIADEHGIVAIGGDLNSERLLNAYRTGIFPWPHESLPLLWFCPDPRFVVEPNKIVINKTLRKTLRSSSLRIDADTNFLGVINKCSAASRKDQDGTWITDDIIRAYHDLFLKGYAHSIEAYENEELVGGLYGVSLGKIFFGESMFFDKSDASKIAFVVLAAHLHTWNFSLIDCQVETQYLKNFGAHEMPRNDFLDEISRGVEKETLYGPWQFFLSPQEALDVLLDPR